MLQLNENLIKNLSHTLRMTYKEISSLSDISMTTLYRIFENPSKISIQQLINLSNGLHVPIRRFICNDNKETIGQREDYIISNGYKKCYYDKAAMQEVMDSDIVSSYRNIASALGLHPNRVKESLLAEHRLPVIRLLKFCNIIKISFSFFVIDRNPIDFNTRDQEHTPVNTNTEYTAIKQDIETMLQEQSIFMTEVRREIAHLNKKIDLIINAFYEDVTASDPPKPTATLAEKVVKEIQNHKVKKNQEEKIKSLPSL